MKITNSLAVAFFLCFCCFCHAQQRVVLDKELQALLADNAGGMMSVNILLKSQPRPDRVKAVVAEVEDKELQRELLVGEFKEHSNSNQATLLEYLQRAEAEGLVSNVSCHWLANAITCDAAREVIESMAIHPEVLAIGYNKEVQIVDGYVAGAVEHVPVSVSSHSTTPHVLQVNADDVWTLGYTGKNVVVAILDSGTNPNHYDLKDHLWRGYADADGDGEKDDVVNGWNFIADNSDITDDYGHGTHCAGIVCGDGTVGNITGVAPDATLMTVKIVNRAGGGTPAQMVAGVEFAVENGADVLSLSLGFKKSQISETDIVLLRRTFENVLLLGVPVCAAAGNDGNRFGAPDNVDYPAACPPPYLYADQLLNAGGLTSVICVGSVNASDEYVSSSSQGPVTWQKTVFDDYPYDAEHIGLIRPDIVAPGDLVYSLKHDENNKYKYMSGTSQATPCVAGVIALMLEKNPSLTPAQICETIEATAKKLTAEKSNLTGSGRIDALAAINAIEAQGAAPYIRVSTYSPESISAGVGKEIVFAVSNTGMGTSTGSVKAVLSTDDPYVDIVNGVVDFGTVEAGEVAEGVFVINTVAGVPDGHIAYMKITNTDGIHEWSDEIAVRISDYARIVYHSNSCEPLKPGRNVPVCIDVVNAGTVATTAATKVALIPTSPYVTVVYGEAELEPMAAGEVRGVEFVVNVDESVPDNTSIGFDLYAVPNNYTDVRSLIYEFESERDADGYVSDGFSSWTTFDASNDGRNHPWWHSSVAGTHRAGNVGAAHSGSGQMMSETYCQASMMEYSIPVDNYLVSPKVKVTADSKFSFRARVHSASWFGEHFGVAVSEKGNTSAADFTTIEEWSITKDDGAGWIEYTVDLAAYAGKEIYVAVRHFFTEEQWAALDYGYDVYILHVDDAMFHNVVDVSTAFVYDNYSRFFLSVEGNPLEAPSDVVAEAVDTRSIRVSWSAVNNAQSYNVYRDGALVATTPEVVYTDGGLSSDTEYSYSVAAVYNKKEYERSNVVKATTGKADYSVKIKGVAPASLAVGENFLDITMVNNGRYEQKSRSTLVLTTTSPYVTVVTTSVSMSYLPVAAESTKSFKVVVDETAPNGHVAEFNLKVTELYEDKNVWDCPFVLTVGEPGGDTSVPEVEAGGRECGGVMYDLSGRRVQNPKAGIFIVGGKKTVVK